MIHGRNLIVALDGVAVAAAKTCSLDMDQSFLEACSPVSGRTHTKIPTTYDWGVSVDGLIANSSSPTVNLEDKLIAGTKCLLTFTDGSGNRRAGFVYVKSCKESGPVGGLATYSASFESTGPLYKYTQDVTYSQVGTPACSIYYSQSSGIQYSFYDSGNPLKGTALGNPTTPQRQVYVIANEPWVILNVSLITARGYLTNKDTTSLANAQYDAGNSPKLVNLSAGAFSVLTNGALGDVKVITLSE